MSNKQFKSLNLRREKIVPALQDFGVSNINYVKKSASGHHHLQGVYEGNDILLNVFETKDGTTTIGHASGYDQPVFERLATEIVARCSYSDKKNFELSIPKFTAESLLVLLDYLASEGASKQEEKELPCGGTQTRWAGPNGDTLTIKAFNNKTVQFQGKHAHLASLVWDCLINVLSLEESLKKQIETYDIGVTVEDIKDELAARIPTAHIFISDAVRKQISSALALCRVNLPLEDFGALAFPALRGLEGFIKQVLIRGKLNPGDKTFVGDYFESKIVGQWVLTSQYLEYVGAPNADVLAASYTLYAKQRHGLFHMDATPETSRILGSAVEAKAIVNSVLDTIENGCVKLLT